MNYSTLFFIYYATFSACILIYAFSVYMLRFKLATASNFAFIFAFLIIALPGFYVADGTAQEVINQKFNRGLDLQLYLIYLIFMPIVVAGLISGHSVSKNIFVKTSVRRYFTLRFNILTIGICSYCFLYLIWLPYIPFNNLFLSTSYGMVDIIKQRIAITHGLGYQENLPFLFRYWRNIAQYILPVIFYYYLISKTKNSYKNRVLILIVLIFTVYLQVFTLEKAPLFMLMVGALFIYLLDKQYSTYSRNTVNIRLIIKCSFGLLITFSLLLIVYKYFMGSNSQLKDLMSRLGSQSASNYVQIDFIRNHGFLGISGIKMPFVTRLLNLEFIDPSKYAIATIYPAYVSGKVMGAAGGMSLTNLFFIMSWYSIPCFFVFVYLFAFFDRIVINSIYSNINKDAFYLNISFYAMFTVNFSIAVGSYIWIVFAIPTFFSPPIIIILFVYLFFIKIPGSFFKNNNKSPIISIQN